MKCGLIFAFLALSVTLTGCSGMIRKVVTMECVNNVCKYTERTSVTMSGQEGQ